MGIVRWFWPEWTDIYLTRCSDVLLWHVPFQRHKDTHSGCCEFAGGYSSLMYPLWIPLLYRMFAFGWSASWAVYEMTEEHRYIFFLTHICYLVWTVYNFFSIYLTARVLCSRRARARKTAAAIGKGGGVAITHGDGGMGIHGGGGFHVSHPAQPNAMITTAPYTIGTSCPYGCPGIQWMRFISSLFTFTVAVQFAVTLSYWAFLWGLDPPVNPSAYRIFIGVVYHGSGPMFLLIDWALCGYPWIGRHLLITLSFGVLYVPWLYLSTVLFDEPLYKGVTFKDTGTAVYVLGVIATFVVVDVFFILVYKWISKDKQVSLDVLKQQQQFSATAVHNMTPHHTTTSPTSYGSPTKQKDMQQSYV